jgi:hypothetical protein
MARLRKHGETIEELIGQGGERLPKKQQLALPHVVEEFLSLVIERPEGYDDMLPSKMREIDRERVGFYKAQEKLRELVALAGNDAIADLADVRDDRQIRPSLIDTLRVWPMPS